MNEQNKKYWIIGGAVVILAIIGIAMYNRSQNVNPTTIGSDANFITVSDQDPDSVAVLVDDASLSASGFIVIYEDAGGLPGNVLKTSNLLTTGDHKNVSIIMAMKPGATYHAGLWGDDGNGEFGIGNDQPLLGSNGNPVVTSFKVKLVSPGGESKG